ncbi:TrmH family RNA methyltransferase [Kriegella aquimaris]|uniref:RNA methyltransferase, TrmH family n=1 Tax=Kriegella aquimaris TaxID=192904 RepID=A0A1G9PK54_9FLAO|nr:RNA methyltransferase [Kriegella aquimaris]SDL99109.1 RNA methyltransferase, TrmH family [Kriegella aquimaris]
MVVKSQIKLIKSLQQKKYRIINDMFVVEGIKTVKELLASDFKVFKIFSDDEDLLAFSPEHAEPASRNELKQMSSLKNASGALGVFYIPEAKVIDFNDWVLVLDNVQDPGNLGTIIRLCDWFGIRHLVCSSNTVDCFNPKVLQATMGSITRVNLIYTNLPEFLKETELPVYGTFMDGAPVHQVAMPEKGILVMGNEANGISQAIENRCDERIAISQFGAKTTESLNVATATAILLNEIRR